MGLSNSAQADSVTDVAQRGSPLCGGDTSCCHKFTITMDATTDSINIRLLSDLYPRWDGCWDWNCLLTQNPGGIYITHSDTGAFTIHNPSHTTAPLTIYLCSLDGGSDRCTDLWTAWQWRSNDGPIQATEALNGCNQPNCGACDLVRIYTGGHKGQITVCVMKGSITPGQATNITFTFNPPVLPCNVGSIQTLPVGWEPDPTNPPTTTSISFRIKANPGGQPYPGILPCETRCFTFGNCDAEPNYTATGHGVQAWLTPNGPNPCAPNNSAFKPNDVGAMLSTVLKESEQNFPNPVNSSSSFKTTIPFSTNGAGEATITVRDETGRIVSSEKMDVMSSGHHFFYFTAEALPAGKYFYQIEFPKGKVIVTTNMVVVK